MFERKQPLYKEVTTILVTEGPRVQKNGTQCSEPPHQKRPVCPQHSDNPQQLIRRTRQQRTDPNLFQKEGTSTKEVTPGYASTSKTLLHVLRDPHQQKDDNSVRSRKFLTGPTSTDSRDQALENCQRDLLQQTRIKSSAEVRGDQLKKINKKSPRKGSTTKTTTERPTEVRFDC